MIEHPDGQEGLDFLVAVFLMAPPFLLAPCYVGGSPDSYIGPAFGISFCAMRDPGHDVVDAGNRGAGINVINMSLEMGSAGGPGDAPQSGIFNRHCPDVDDVDPRPRLSRSTVFRALISVVPNGRHRA